MTAMTMPDHEDAQRISARKAAEHKEAIERIAEKNKKAHLAATKRREAARKMSARLRRGLDGEQS